MQGNFNYFTVFGTKAYQILFQDCNLMFNMQTALMQHMKFSHPESYKNRDNKRGTKRSDKLKIKSENHKDFKIFKGKQDRRC